MSTQTQPRILSIRIEPAAEADGPPLLGAYTIPERLVIEVDDYNGRRTSLSIETPAPFGVDDLAAAQEYANRCARRDAEMSDPMGETGPEF